MDTKQGKSAIDVINGLQDLPPVYYRMVVDALRDAVGCALCGGNDHNADECKRFAGERESFEEWYPTGCPVAGVTAKLSALAGFRAGADWQARAAQTAPVVPDGYVLVPVEPTEAMRAAYEMSAIAPMGPISIYGYRAMLGAAPAAPAQGQQVDRWIPVSERLPDPTEHIRVFAVSALSDAVTIWATMSITRNPEGFAYWMPLPAAPTQGGGV